jgi:hypothetical protein
VNEEQALVRVERELFIGFYAIRKLFETFKVSRRRRAMEFSMISSPCVKSVDYTNKQRIEEPFDLNIKNTEQHDLGFICNQFIHSYIFSSVWAEDQMLAGLFICSDKLKHEKLYFFDLSQALAAFRTVGNDYPEKQHFRRNEATHQWEGNRITGLIRCLRKYAPRLHLIRN